PEGKARPRLTEKISPNAISGHAIPLELVVEHGPGETVLPTGFRVDPGSSEAKGFEASGFVFPDPAGPSAPKIERKPAAEKATTHVKLFFVPLPKKPGRNALTLPPVPIAIARASGEIMTVCTSAHAITVEDPIANEPNPKPKPNPAPRRQLEEWTLAKQVAIAAAIALVVGALGAWLISRWLRRPKPVTPPPPPRPPWEVALEGLFDVQHSGLLAEGRHAEFYDRVSDVIRRYLGDRYGYDGLESTTREALGALRRQAVPLETFVSIQAFLQDADLVKFARRGPSTEECSKGIASAEEIVRRTTPLASDGAPVRAATPEAAS
ncbi:MAG TPA: hypothetical protein VIM73_19600, partial [Polyangiaceae bacterium]